jgi:MPBQ/MSBQ methyltransferase
VAPWAGWAAAGALAFLAIKKVYDTPSRSYDGNVGDEYDAWTEEGILEYYWGEHIHLGYYTEEELKKGWWTADFKAAKLRFTEEMYRFSKAQQPKTILDVGCGFGGSSRWMAATNPQAQVTGEDMALGQWTGWWVWWVKQAAIWAASSIFGGAAAAAVDKRSLCKDCVVVSSCWACTC